MKSKVIAFRVTQEEYEALALLASMDGKKLAHYVDDALMPTIQLAMSVYTRERKRAEAKAKRDAKKAAANGVQ
jgi:predicted DNA-binding protein